MGKSILGTIAALLGLSCSVHKAESINLKHLPDVLDRLVQNQMEHDFFGITSNGVDCLYFAQEDGKLCIEYEVMTNAQIPFVDQLKAFADKRGLPVVETTYGNKPQYASSTDAPVYRIQVTANIREVAQLGETIMKEVFECNDSTTFEVVP